MLAMQQLTQQQVVQLQYNSCTEALLQTASAVIYAD
jgi:hypothetical protein